MNIYEYAKEKYESITPIRGKRASQDIRPVGKRTRDHERIAKVGDAYAYRMCNTDILTIYPDGTAKFDANGRVSPSTVDFINRAVPFMSAFRSQGWMWIKASYTPEVIPINARLPIWFKFVDGEYKTWELTSKVHLYKQVINREKSKEVRKLAAEFKDFAKVMIPIIDWGSAYESTTYLSTRYSVEIEDREHWLDKLMSMYDRNWDWKAREYKTVAPTMKQMHKIVNDQLYVKYEPYDYVEVPLTDGAQNIYKIEVE